MEPDEPCGTHRIPAHMRAGHRQPGAITPIGLMILIGREDEARAAVLGSLEIFAGNLTASAADLGLSIRQMHRVIDRLELREELARIRAREI